MQNPATVPNFDTGDMRDRLVRAGADDKLAKGLAGALADSQGELVTKADIALLQKGINGRMDTMQADLSGKMDTVKVELRGEMTAMKAELRGEMTTMKVDLEGKMDTLQADLNGKMDIMQADLNGKMNTLQAETNGKIDKISADLNLQISMAKNWFITIVLGTLLAMIGLGFGMLRYVASV